MSHQQPDTYGPHDQHPGPYGPPQDQISGASGRRRAPKKGRRPVWVAAVVGAAVLAAGCGAWLLLGDERYQLVHPAQVDGFKRATGEKFTPPDREETEKLIAAGVEDAVSGPQSTYSTASDPDSETPEKDSETVTVSGSWGEVKDPRATLDALMAQHEAVQRNTEKESAKNFKGPFRIELTPVREMTPEGIEDAVMKCRFVIMHIPRNPGLPEEMGAPRTYRMPRCQWADSSTVGSAVTGKNDRVADGNAHTLEETAALTAKFRKAMRTPVR
ncbi:hypothetical protein [Streptomyces sp. NPDC048442]|uniref:hypothetical protein n=1 Tax=Streptomyces sp. NPDC048442 TaxID=3154823 RepID=UPI0034162AA8